MMIEIHMIQNHSPANLNRDDLGAPKTCIFGGTTRARISSQAQKRSIRKPGNPHDVHGREGGMFAEAMQGRIGCRTKLFPWLVSEQLKAQDKLGIVEEDQIPADAWPAIVTACTTVAQKADKESSAENAKHQTDRLPATKQLIFLTPRHAAEFVKKLSELRKSDRASYDYFQDPRVAFTSLLEEELDKTILDEEERKKAAKNGWLIVKYPHRWQALNAWVGKSTVMEDKSSEASAEDQPIHMRQLRETPGQEEAEFLAETISEMASQVESDNDTKALFNDLLKGKVSGSKSWRGNKEEKITDARQKPPEYGDFRARLWNAAGPMSVDIALFGRMTTSEAFEDVEAAMQVAHAISTHAVVNEVDYFTAVDDLGKAGGGAGHVDEAMFNSACFYKYFCLDWDQILYNLAGREPDPKKDAEGHKKWEKQLKPQVEQLAACTLGHFIRAAALTTPSGKQNSFASHCEPCGILVEIKDAKIPTSYANAFAEPVERIGKPDDDGPDEQSIEGRSVGCLADHVQSLCKAYGIESRRFWYSPKLWRFPLNYWERAQDGKKTEAKSVKADRFDVLGGVDGKPEGLVEAVVKAVGFDWSEIKDLGKVSEKGA